MWESLNHCLLRFLINRVVDEVPFYTWSRNRSHRDSGVEFFTFVDTFSRFLCYLYVVVGPASEQENLCSDRQPKRAKCVFFWFPRWFPKKEKKNAFSLLNTSYNVVTKQFIFVIWIKAFLVFLVKTWSHRFVPNENKTKQTKIITRLADSFGNSMVHDNILLSCNISFNPLLRKSSFRSLKCSERNWPMYSLLSVTLVQECKRI